MKYIIIMIMLLLLLKQLSFIVLMEIFEFIAKGLTYHKLSQFDYFLLTKMKLRLNLTHYGIGY